MTLVMGTALQKLRELVEGTTPGPWKQSHESILSVSDDQSEFVCLLPVGFDDSVTRQGEVDAAAICALQRAAPLLLKLWEVTLEGVRVVDKQASLDAARQASLYGLYADVKHALAQLEAL